MSNPIILKSRAFGQHSHINCPYCGQGLLVSEWDMHHDGSNQPVKCGACDLTFYLAVSLRPTYKITPIKH